MKMRVLIAEDENKLADALVQILAKNKITADAAYNGIDALDNALSGIYDVIVLDIMMPGMDGIEVLRRIRAEGMQTPVLMFTAKDEISDKVRGLDSGADDYLTKPFATDELLARIRAVMKRSAAPAPAGDNNVLKFEGLEINMSGREVFVDGKPVSLTPKEYDLLFYLVRNKGIALSREKLLEEVWGYDFYGDDRTVDTHIKMLRNSLGDYRKFIVTLRGMGYKFDAGRE